MKFKILSVFCLTFCLTFNANAQKKVKALFLGNSYTDVNNLPEIVKQVALSAGDTLVYSKNAPGGYTFQMHTTNATSLGLIQAGGWDFVVLQEQSQLPAFPDPQVMTQVYPYAHALDSMIKVYNPCATTLFYMTWGRKFGDASNCAGFPPICTYEGMDSLLQLRYTIMAQNNGAAIAPVARVWHKMRDDYPGIDLYSSDNSHPNNNGSFAAACTFYAAMFAKNPKLAPYNYTVNAAYADTIRSVTKAVVYDSLDYWYRFVPDRVQASFTYTATGLNVTFVNTSMNGTSYNWNFGDGFNGTTTAPSHTYSSPGTYTVTLTAYDSCSRTDVYQQSVTVTPTGVSQLQTKNEFEVYPNPAKDALYIVAAKPLNEIQIFDFINRKIKEYFFTGETNATLSIDVSTLHAGTYFIRGVRSDGQIMVSKFNKSH